jgi:hypothetical protein
MSDVLGEQKSGVVSNEEKSRDLVKSVIKMLTGIT